MKSNKHKGRYDEELAVLYWNTPERRVFDLSAAGLPEIPALGMSRFSRVLESSAMHNHTGCIEIGLCLRGALTLINKGEAHQILPGDLYINKPDESHGLAAHPKGTMLHWLLIRQPEPEKTFLRMTWQEATLIWEQLSELPCHVSGNTEGVKQAFALLFKSYKLHDTPLGMVGLISGCTSLLLATIETATYKRSETVHKNRIDKTAKYIKAHMEQKLDQDKLAEQAGMSPSLFSSCFKTFTGLPPYQYQLACRLEKAKLLLTTSDKSITEIAFSLGFCASQHFSAHFKRATGVTPLVWRKKLTEMPDNRCI